MDPVVNFMLHQPNHTKKVRKPTTGYQRQQKKEKIVTLFLKICHVFPLF